MQNQTVANEEDKNSIVSDVSEVSTTDGKYKISICKCGNSESNVGDIIEKIVSASKGKGKTTIKLEIEISNE